MTLGETGEEPGCFARLGDRTADNFSAAFQAPLGPGAWYDEWTAPSGIRALDMVSRPFYGAVKGGLWFGDAALRGGGAGYNSLVDTGTEALVSAGMRESEAARLGRDVKAMPEAFMARAGMLPGAWAMRTGGTLQPVAEGAPFVSIGNSGYRSIGEFTDAATARYQALYDQGYAIATQRAAQGIIPNTKLALGFATDEFAWVGLRDWVTNVEGLQEGAGRLIQINRRLYDPSGLGSYRIPDV